MRPPLSFLTLQGSPREVGLQLGRFGRAAVHEHLLRGAAWASLQAWRDSAALTQMQSLTQARFPGIWQELEGMAAGLELPVRDVFLWNCRGDLWAMAPDGCSTVLLPGPDGHRLSHNEDGDPGFAGRCAIAAFRIQGSPAFASFAYPGSLPGHTFAANDHGLAMTVNNIRALHCQPGLPRMVLARAMLDCADIAAAVGLLRDAPRAGAFHFSLSHPDAPSLASVEFGTHACSVVEITAPAFHANHAIHDDTRDDPQIITGSSGFRQKRGEFLLAQARRQGHSPDPLAILGDTGDARFPILRHAPDDSDAENTMASADFRITTSGVAWQVHTHPAHAPVCRLHNGHFDPIPDSPGAA